MQQRRMPCIAVQHGAEQRKGVQRTAAQCSPTQRGHKGAMRLGSAHCGVARNESQLRTHKQCDE
eukprot:15126797-Alexandrium_andersonii.AAC.1